VSARVVAARLVGTFGLRGELKCVPTGAGEGAILAGRSYPLAAAGDSDLVTLSAVRQHQGRLLVSVEGATTVDAAQVLVGKELYVERAAVHLAEGEYLDEDLVGLQLIDEAGTALGVVQRIEHYPAQDCLVVGPSGALVPLVRAFVRSIDLVSRTIEVTLPPGLLDPAAAEEA
jgi:16S rRNA processing protein RimM